MSTILIDNKNAKWLVLFGLISCLALVFLDQSAVPVTLSAIQRQLLMSELGLQWILNSYLLVIAVLIIPAGKLADIYGHKKFFTFGMLIFLFASCICAGATNSFFIIAGRSIQGLGAAIMLPSSAAIITDVVPPQERGKMMGIYISVASIFLAFGPMIGGLVTHIFGWQSIFLINLPFIIFSLVMINKATQVKPTFITAATEKVDWLGLTWLALSITPMIVALLQSGLLGWCSPIIWCLIFASLISLLFFIKAEGHRSQALLDLNILTQIPIRLSIIIVVITQYAIISTAFWPSFFETIFQFNDAQAGLGLLPVTLPILIISPIAGQIRDKYGPRLPIGYGALCLIVGSLWIGISAWSENYFIMLPGLLIFGCGPSSILACVMTILFSNVPPQKRSSIAGFTSFFRQLTSAVGLALTSAILNICYLLKSSAGTHSLLGSLFAFSCSTIVIAFLSLIIVYSLRYLPKQTVTLEATEVDQGQCSSAG